VVIVFRSCSIKNVLEKIPPSSSKNPQPSAGLKPKEQPPKIYVDLRNERFAENKQILKDGGKSQIETAIWTKIKIGYNKPAKKAMITIKKKMCIILLKINSKRQLFFVSQLYYRK